MRLNESRIHSVNGSRNPSGAIPGGNGMEWNGGDVGHPSIVSTGGATRRLMDGSLRDQIGGV